MIEFLKDCVHDRNLNILYTKKFDLAYIKELEIKIKKDAISAVQGKNSIAEIKNKISEESEVTMDLIMEIEKAYKDSRARDDDFPDILRCYNKILMEYFDFLYGLENIIYKVINDPEYWNERMITETENEPATDVQPQSVVNDLKDEDCIQMLANTGFIKQNPRIENKTVYGKERSVTVPKIYNKLLEMTGDSERARRIMLNNISGVEAGLKTYLSRLSKNTK